MRRSLRCPTCTMSFFFLWLLRGPVFVMDIEITAVQQHLKIYLLSVCPDLTEFCLWERMWFWHNLQQLSWGSFTSFPELCVSQLLLMLQLLTVFVTRPNYNNEFPAFFRTLACSCHFHLMQCVCFMSLPARLPFTHLYQDNHVITPALYTQTSDWYLTCFSSISTDFPPAMLLVSYIISNIKVGPLTFLYNYTI